MAVLTKPLEPIIKTPIIGTDSDLAALEVAAYAKSEKAFLTARKRIDWTKSSAQDFLRAIDLGLMAGAHLAARNLSAEGAAYFPENSELQKIAQTLAPPKVTVMKEKKVSTWKANREWLKTNWELYQGQWVALRNGELLGANESLDVLVAQVGNVKGRDIMLAPLW